MLKKLLLIVLILMGTLPVLQAQTGSDKGQLEKERQDIQNELRQMQDMYSNVKGKTKLSVRQLNILKNKINLQERYISSINKELKMIDDDIYLSNLEIFRLQKQLDTLKAQYARTIVYAYKNRSNYDYVNFIFSANSFNDAIKRISYLKSYRAYREKQVTTILETQQLIAKRQTQQLGRKQEKNVALQNQTKQKNELDVQRKEKDAVVAELKSQEKDLGKEIAAKKKRDRDIQNALAAIVRREIAKATEDAKRNALAAKKNEAVTANPTAPKTTTPVDKPANNRPISYLDVNASDVKLNEGFEQNKGKLPWPVDKAFVSVHFGPYTIEGTGIKNINPGITIVTPDAGVSVKSVFDGEVAAINNYGDGMMVVVRHGKYFTTYSNLSSVSVSKGTQIKTGQLIGKAGNADDGSGGQVDFILMIESKNVNPESWLRH